MDPRQPGAIAQALQMPNRTQMSVMDTVTGRRPTVPMEERVNRMSGLQKDLGDDEYSKLMEMLLQQETPRLDAQRGDVGGVMKMLMEALGGTPRNNPQQMLEQMRRRTK